MSDNNNITTKITTGKCEEFCPKKEYKLRIREKLVHKYESPQVNSVLLHRIILINNYN